MAKDSQSTALFPLVVVYLPTPAHRFLVLAARFGVYKRAFRAVLGQKVHTKRDRASLLSFAVVCANRSALRRMRFAPAKVLN